VSETFVATQLLELERAGHEVSIISQHRPRTDDPEHDAVRSSTLLHRTTYVAGELEADSLDPRPSISLEPGDNDVLHAHFGPNARRFLFARAQAGAPFVATFHGYDFSAQPVEHGPSMYARLFDVADAVTVNCEHARREVVRLGCRPDRVHVVRVGIDCRAHEFRARRYVPGRPLRILTVARLVEKKGHEIAFRALASARAALPELRYDVVGDGPLAGSLADLVRQLGLQDVVQLHGALRDSDVRRHLARADVFVLASLTARSGDQEGTPVSLMEAQACGIPVVSTHHSGIPEVVQDGRSGFLVEEGDADALSAGLVRMVREHDDWSLLGATGRAHVEAEYDVRVCTAKLVDLYGVALRRYAQHAPAPALG
jgi:colanic acid/amylovoran biosynthesis glycosyltransferase